MRAPKLAAIAAAAALLGGCGTAEAAEKGDTAREGMGDAPAVAPFGTGCTGDIDPRLSTFLTATRTAGMEFTVFSPTKASTNAYEKNAYEKDVLAYHVVPRRLTPTDLAGRHRTLQGASIDVVGQGSTFLVDAKARVVCGNIRTAGATVYLIDAVLTPPAR